MAREAIKAGDKSSIAAILAAPPFLSGMSAEEFHILESEAELAFAPQECAQLKAGKQVLEHMRKVGGHVIKNYSDLLALKNSPQQEAHRSLARLSEKK